ncbi:MAG TPA: TRAP transporter large permease [Pseudolabrys sp.]|nr:TRAP transporter large permease [Pseudolabrys sp.]
MSMPAFLFGLIGALLLLRVPLAFALGIATVATMALDHMPLTSLAVTYFSAVDNFAFMAIPLFLLAGSFMEHGGISKRLIDVSDVLLGRLIGGLSLVTVGASMFFGALTGSGNTATAAVGSLMIPTMIKRGYAPSFAGAVTAVGGTMGILIPPSISLIVYGIMADLSVARLFLAGVVPGIILGAALMITAFIISKKRGYKGTQTKFSTRGLRQAMFEGKWALLAPVVILGGIYGGFITPTESAVVAVIYGFIVGAFLHKELTFDKVILSIKSTMAVTGILGIIWATALGFGELLTLYQVPQLVSKAILGVTSSAAMALVLISVWETFIGMWMNTMAQIIIMTPIYLQIINTLGIDPITFGIIFTLNCEIGFVTPPLGTSLFVAMPIADVKLGEISLAAIPFIIAMFVVIGLIIAFPEIPLWLPNLIMGRGI